MLREDAILFTKDKRGAASVGQNADALPSRLLPFLLPLPLFFALAVNAALADAYRNDFGFFYFAAHIVRDGHGHQLYSFALQRAYQMHEAHNITLFFYYPAATVLPILPFALLPFHAALLAWDLASLLAIAICGSLLTQGQPAPRRIIGSALIYLFGATMFLLTEGQITAIVLIALTGAWLNREKPLRAGLWLSLGLLKFHLIAGFIVVLALRRKWRELAGVSFGASALYVIGAAIAGWLWPLREIQLAPIGERLGATAAIMPNLHGLAAVAGINMGIVGVASVAVLMLAAMREGSA